LKTYYEDSDGYWEKWGYKNGQIVYFEDSKDEKGKWKYNENGELIYFTNFAKRNININIEYK